VWGGDRLHTWEQLRNPHGNGWYIERHRLEAMLRDAAVDAGARLVPASVRRVQRRAGAVRLFLDDATEVDARSIVDATGRSAAGARRLGARRVQHDRLIGLAWRHEAEPDQASLVESVPEGWWFSAPTAAGMIVILFGDADLVDWRSASHRYPELLDQAPHTRARVAAAGPMDGPTLVSASTSVLRPTRGPGWIAVGDAAATYDPLASYGILHSLITGWEAAAAIAQDEAIAYEQRERERFDEHLRQRCAQYEAEQRWGGAAFWRRRSQTPPTEPERRKGRVGGG
jgi:flavin-dependent dehydrogenase